MTQRSGHIDGAPCWADLSTPDLAGAQRFYAALLGWTFDEADAKMGYYTNCRKDGRRVAGMAPKHPDQDLPTAWSVYLQSSAIDETARKTVEAGGRLMMPPMDIPGSGRMMYGFDPTRAAFGVWQPGDHRGAELTDAPGAMCWHELNTRDGGAADEFYRGLFGYEVEQIGDGAGFDYAVWKLDGRVLCGRMQMTSEYGDLPPHWMTYFAVEDCDASAEQIKALGGKVLQGPFDSPYGRIAVVTDPYGAVFSIIKMSPPAA